VISKNKIRLMGSKMVIVGNLCSFVRKRRLFDRYLESSIINGIRCLSDITNSLENGPSNPKRKSTSQAAECRGMVLFDSLTQSYKCVESDENKGLAWYTCGPTVYDAAHLGHARTYVCLDLIHRWLLYSKKSSERRAIFIMNVTDVDDKIIARAKETEIHPLEMAKRFEREFFEDLDALNVMRPNMLLRVSEHVESHIVPYIQKIMLNGFAYLLPEDNNQSTEGSVYFDVTAFERSNLKVNRYGKLAPSEAATAASSFYESSPRGHAVKPQKRDHRDFVLWKLHKQQDGDLWWDSPWGRGRPGWHIECSAMIHAAMSILHQDYQLQVHAGGVDLKFPHHTNEIAQAEAFYGTTEWIPHWLHTGHLYIQGLKMSKSLKNFITIRDMLQDHQNEPASLACPADDFRLWCLGLSGPYKGSATYSKSRLNEARRIRETKFLRFLIDGQSFIEKAKSTRITACLHWTPNDFKFWNISQHKFSDATEAMNGSVESSFDMDGSSCLVSLISVCDLGMDYLSSVEPGLCTMEPLELIISQMRDFLKVLGFSEITYLAGRRIHSRENQANSLEPFAKELVDFRSKIRSLSLEGLRGGELDATLKNILVLCDEMRESKLPSIGIEVSDNQSDSKWRFCIPRKELDKVATIKKSVNLPVPLEEFFRVGEYEKAFSTFDKDGIPLTNHDGTDVSKSMRKKLLKKRQKHEKWLASINISSEL